MEIYERFKTKDFDNTPIVIETFNVIVEDEKAAYHFLRSKYNKNIECSKILECCNGIRESVGNHKFEDGRREKYRFRYATEQETKEFNEIKQKFIKENKESRNYYVYKWYYINTGVTFYVGKGTNDRYKELIKGRRNAFFNNVVSVQKNNIASEKIHEKLTEKEALELENKTISELLNDGYTLISSTPYYEYNSNIDFDTSNEKILMNILNGGENEQRNKVVGKQSRKKMSESQKKYSSSKEGKKKNSDSQLIAQNRPETVQRKRDSLKKHYENDEAIIKASNAAKIWQEDPSKFGSRGDELSIYCIELDKTFVSTADTIVYFDKYFDTYIDGRKIATAIKNGEKCVDGVLASGTVLIPGEKYYKQLHWRLATKEEVQYENLKRIKNFELNKKAEILEAIIEEEIEYELLLDIIEELDLMDFLYKRDGKYFLPKDCKEILNDLSIEIEEKIEPYILEREIIESNKPDCVTQTNRVQNSYDQKFNKSTPLKCVSSSGIEHIFGTPDDATEYLLKFNDKVSQGITIKRNIQKKKNWQYLKDDTGRLTWSIVDKDSKEYRNFIKSYDNAYEIYINSVLEYIEEEENNELINKLNKIKELYVEK